MKLLLLLLTTSLAAAELPRTILFADDDDVLYRPGTIKRVIEFKKHPGNPVLPPDKPWEGMIGWNSLHRDPATGRYQMWYQAYQERRTEDKSLRCVVCYAESMDGITWAKPNLGLFPFYEEKDTNIVLVGAKGAYGDRYCNSVLVDTLEKDPAKRYKMLYYDWISAPGKDGAAGTHVAFSPDGIRWTKRDGLIASTSFGHKGAQAPFADEGDYFEVTKPGGAVVRSWRAPITMSDALDLIWDPRLKVYAAYGKMWTPAPDGSLAWKHAMGRIESKDFVTWTRPELVCLTDDRDPPQVEFHTSPVFFYNGMYFSINQNLDRAAGTMDAEFMSSRDGRRWDRSFANRFVIPRGGDGQFDSGSIITNGTPVILEDEMRFYYAGYRGTAIGGVNLNKQVVGAKDYHSGVGMAVTPRDRIVAVGINPGTPVKGQKKDKPRIVNTIGHVTLRALDLTGVKTITLNADASAPKASVRLEILNEDGYRLRGFTKEDAVPHTTDGLALAAAWKEKKISDLPPGRCQLRIHLTSADLFAVTLK